MARNFDGTRKIISAVLNPVFAEIEGAHADPVKPEEIGSLIDQFVEEAGLAESVHRGSDVFTTFVNSLRSYSNFILEGNVPWVYRQFAKQFRVSFIDIFEHFLQRIFPFGSIGHPVLSKDMLERGAPLNLSGLRLDGLNWTDLPKRVFASGATFVDVDMSGIEFSGFFAERARFFGCNLDGTRIPDLDREGCLNNALFTRDTSARGAKIYAPMRGAKLDKLHVTHDTVLGGFPISQIRPFAGATGPMAITLGTTSMIGATSMIGVIC